MPNDIKVSWESQSGEKGETTLNDFGKTIELLQIFLNLKYKNICMEISAKD